MENFESVEEYIIATSEEAQKKLREMRQIIREIAPEAEEKISYGIIGYKQEGRPLVYIGGFKKHVSLFAAGSQLIAKKFAKELEGYIQSKGTIQFSLDKPLPLDLIRQIVQARFEENKFRTK